LTEARFRVVIFVKIFAKIRFLCQRNASGNMQNLAKFLPQNFFTFKAKMFSPFCQKRAKQHAPKKNKKLEMKQIKLKCQKFWQYW
jgi:hypothetical protein